MATCLHLYHVLSSLDSKQVSSLSPVTLLWPSRACHELKVPSQATKAEFQPFAWGFLTATLLCLDSRIWFQNHSSRQRPGSP